MKGGQGSTRNRECVHEKVGREEVGRETLETEYVNEKVGRKNGGRETIVIGKNVHEKVGREEVGRETLTNSTVAGFRAGSARIGRHCCF